MPVALWLQSKAAMWTCQIGLALLLCGAGCSESECASPHIVTSSDGTESGTLRVGTAFQVAFPALALTPDGGVVCMTCLDGFTRMDRDLKVKAEVGGAMFTIAIGPDGTIYTELPFTADDGAMQYDSVALEPTGALRWHVPSHGTAWRRLVAAVSGGMYYDGSSDSVLQTGFLGAARGDHTAFLGQRLLAADDDGLFTVATSADTADQPATLSRLDPTGAVTWQRTWTTPTAGVGVTVDGAAVIPDGGLIVVGQARDTVDFGDRMLPLAPDLTAEFLVALDAAGATRWAYRLPSIPVRWLAALPSGDVLLAGEIVRGEFADAMLTVATPTGVARSFSIDGPAVYRIDGLAASPDGLAWLLVSDEPAADGEDEAVMHISGQEFREIGVYLFSIVP